MSQPQLPGRMQAVVLDSYSGIESLRVEQRPVPRPGKNEVLIKVAASPINPSDLMFLEGLYGFRKPTPVVPGFEGSGTVVAVGPGLIGRYLNGRRVACFSQDKGDGVWAEYMVTTANFALPLAKSVSLEQGAMSAVNPLTAIAILSIARQGGHKVILHTAAASALGQMLVRLAPAEGIDIVNIVRRQSQVELLKQQGAGLVLNSSEANFEQQLRDACRQHRIRLAFDAVAGPLSMQLLDAMPRHSKVTVYGALSLAPAQAHPGKLIFQGKSMDGFWLTDWLRSKNFLSALMLWRRTQKLLSGELKSDIRARYPFTAARQAALDYQAQMTGGKVLLVAD